MEQRLFSKNFTLVVIGQVISLFGNAAIRFALPLYLLNETGSSTLFGTVTACAFLPAILLTPVGGIVADRVNKRNIMVILDFFTAAVIAVFSALVGGGSLVPLTVVTLMLLYGIAGAYQPAVQASIPALVSQGHIMAANSVVNIISSLAALSGPVLGGILYSNYGLGPVLWVCTLCFVLSAVMELFIRIPFHRRESGGGVWRMVKRDLAESIRFIRRDKPVIGKVVSVVCGVNLFLSAMILVGLPYLVTEVMFDGSGYDSAYVNKLYGYAQGALAAGSLAGGIGAGIMVKRMKPEKTGNLLIVCAAFVFPVGISQILSASGMVHYLVMALCCFIIMFFSTIFTVQMMSFIQTETPGELVGKVIAVVLMLSMCAQPLGNALYGVLFDLCEGFEYAVILFAGSVSLAVAVCTKKIFERLKGQEEA